MDNLRTLRDFRPARFNSACNGVQTWYIGGIPGGQRAAISARDSGRPIMPVKIRCRNCEKVLNAPDKAKGRIVQCPSCGTKLRVPGGDAPAKKQPAKAKAGSVEGEDFLARMDLDDLEHEEEKICPYCAAEMDEDEVVCRSCGMNTEKGQMDAREAKKRARKGPDPALFYSKAWSDSFQFVREHVGLAVKTGMYLTGLAVLNNMCAFMVVFCRTGPPKTFWALLTILTSLGMYGWFWSLSYKVIECTMTRNEKLLERLSFDLFQVIAVGLRFVMWPIVLLGPFIFPIMLVMSLLGAITMSVGGAAAFGILGALFALGMGAVLLWFYPIATVHMTQEYTYKAWILWELLKVGIKNIGPSAYFFVIAIVAMIPVVLVAVPLLLFVVGPPFNPFQSENVYWVTGGITGWFLELIGERVEPDGWLFRLIVIPLNFIATFIVLAPIYLVAGFPLVFLMRVNGLLGYYNHERLDLVNRVYPNTTATFWVRALAHCIDLPLVPLASVLISKDRRILMVSWFFNAALFVTWKWLPPYIAGFIAFPAWLVYMYWMYFSVSESTTTRTTIGKDAFGLIVNDLGDKQIKMQKATLRSVGRMICTLTGGLGYLMAALPPQKRGLHDYIAGTKVCWRGDR